MTTTIPLHPSQFTESERLLVESAGLRATAFRTPTGVAALRLSHARGHVVVLPWQGQIVWDAIFDGVRLTMGSLFDAPRPANEIIDTYGCLAFHSGVLRNGCPSPEDTHALHGEMPCAAMDSAALVIDADEEGVYLRLTGERCFVRGFGNRYVASPSVTLHDGATQFDIAMTVTNTGGLAMDLMYMCHVNFAFVADGMLLQPCGTDPGSVVVRTSIPAHVPSNPAHAARLAALARDPSPMQRLDPGAAYDPELVFYLHGLGRDSQGQTHLMLLRPEGDGFAMSYDPVQLPHTVRWLLRNADHSVAAFALPATCEPEGFIAEQRKGNVRQLAPGETAAFRVRAGYLDRTRAGAMARAIAALGDPTKDGNREFHGV